MRLAFTEYQSQMLSLPSDCQANKMQLDTKQLTVGILVTLSLGVGNGCYLSPPSYKFQRLATASDHAISARKLAYFIKKQCE